MARNRKLGRTSAQRKAMLRNLATDLIVHERITTTVTRAKEVRSVAEELITLAKRGDLHARRQVASVLRNVVTNEATGQSSLQKLFDDVAPRYTTVNGGYTRILKTENRRGDDAPMAIIELI